MSLVTGQHHFTSTSARNYHSVRRCNPSKHNSMNRIEHKNKIAVLCANAKSVYHEFAICEVYDQKRDAYTFEGSNPIIAHPPCGQWSRLKSFAKSNIREKELAYFCLIQVLRNGGVFEHPAGSHFFKHVGLKSLLSVDQHWWNFPARKRTYLFFYNCKAAEYSIHFNAIEKNVEDLHSSQRATTTKDFASFLINSITTSHPLFTSQLKQNTPCQQ